MKLINKINNCEKPKLSTSGELVYISNGIIQLPHNIIKGEHFGFELVKNRIFTYNSSINKTQVYNIKDGSLFYENENLLYPRRELDARNREDIIFGQFSSNQEKYWVDFDNFNYNIIQKYPMTYRIFNLFNNCFLSKKENILLCNDINNGESILWQKTFPEKINGDILIYNDKLLVSFDESLTCLNQNDGKEIWTSNEVYGYQKIIEGDYSYQLAGHYFSIVDLTTGIKIDEANIEHLNNKEKIFPAGDMQKNGNWIYFICSATYPERLPTVGRFNIKTHEYDWIYRFENVKGYGFSGTNCLQYHEGKLYVLTSDGVLHIFEED